MTSWTDNFQCYVAHKSVIGWHVFHSGTYNTLANATHEAFCIALTHCQSIGENCEVHGVVTDRDGACRSVCIYEYRKDNPKHKCNLRPASAGKLERLEAAAAVADNINKPHKIATVSE